MSLVPTSIDQLKQVKLTEVIELSPFPNGTPLNVEVRRPSVLEMMFNNEVPNHLMTLLPKITEHVNNVTDGKDSTLTNEEVTTFYDFLEKLCKKCLVAPTYNEILENVGKLSFDQMFDVYAWVFRDVKEIAETFRTKRGYNDADTDNVENVRQMSV